MHQMFTRRDLSRRLVTGERGPWGARRHAGGGTGYPGPMSVLALEIFFTSLLVLSTVVILWFSVFVVWRLFRGQR